MSEPAIPAVLPPEPHALAAPERLPLPLLPSRHPHGALLVATAKIDHSGRIGDRVLLAALDWRPGDGHDMRAMPHGAIARRSPAGPFHIDVRHNLFIPVAMRDFVGIKCGDRLVLVASLRTGVLVVHPMGVVSALLNRFYRSIAGEFDAQ